MNQINTSFPFIGVADTRIGGRKENQDSAGWTDTPFGFLLLVCDGMGGGPGGKTASSKVVEVVLNIVSNADTSCTDLEQLLRHAVSQAHQSLLSIMDEQEDLRGMGSTIVALLIGKKSAVVAHVGDSRIYKLRCRQIAYRTQDHSMVGELVRKGTLTEEQARLSAQSNIITRAIGAHSTGEAEVHTIAYEKGDRFLLCTDGIWGQMPEKELVRMATEKRSLSSVAERIISKADQIGVSNGGNHDNMTIALLQTKYDSLIKEKMNRKARHIIMAMASAIAILLVAILILLPQSYKASNMESREAEAQKYAHALEDSIKSLTGQMAGKDEDSERLRKQVEQGLETNKTLNSSVTTQSEQMKRLEEEKKVLENEIKALKEQLEAQKAKPVAPATKPATTNEPKLTYVQVKEKVHKLVQSAINLTGRNCTRANALNKQKEIIDTLGKLGDDATKEQKKAVSAAMEKAKALALDTKVSPEQKLTSIAITELKEVAKSLK